MAELIYSLPRKVFSALHNRIMMTSWRWHALTPFHMPQESTSNPRVPDRARDVFRAAARVGLSGHVTAASAHAS